MTARKDRATKLKELLAEFAGPHGADERDSQVIDAFFDDRRLSLLDEDIAYLSSDQAIGNPLRGVNALAPSSRARDLARNLASDVRQLRATIEMIDRLPAREIEAFVHATYRSQGEGDRELDLQLRDVGDMHHWDELRVLVHQYLALLEVAASEVLDRYTQVKQPRIRKPSPKKPNGNSTRAVIDPGPVQACCRLYAVIRAFLAPLCLSSSDRRVRALTLEVWALYRDDIQIDVEAFKNALDTTKRSLKQFPIRASRGT